jgi:hypothetical protein
LVVAGWTGRDRAVVEKHITELAALGVPRPASVPVFYRVSASRLTHARAIEVSGDASSGEVEFMFIRSGGAWWVGTGSDHTDRKVESYNITVSKQMCDKPVAGELWPYESVSGHWDRLMLRSWAVTGDRKELYQEGEVSALLAPDALLSGQAADGVAVFGGTLPAIGGIRAASRFEFELEDPVRNLRIRHAYDVRTLPLV